MQYIDPSLIKKLIRVLIFNLFLFSFVLPLSSQDRDYETVKKMIQEFKKDERGPYQAIRWFCPDGSILPPKERCPEPGGIQHALPKDIVQKLATESNIYLGQILAGSDFSEFFDEINLNLRLQEYQMEKFLQAVDDGWIMRRARYYRGAVQAEDEETWGKQFLQWLVAKDDVIREQFFLVRQIVSDIPHQANNDKWMSIRGLSKTISDSVSSFMDLRVKLHGQPEFHDIQRVKVYYTKNQKLISTNMQSMLQTLIEDLQIVYHNSDIPALQVYLKKIEATSPLNQKLKDLVSAYEEFGEASSIPNRDKIRFLEELANLLYLVREQILDTQVPSQRLIFLNFSNDIENILFQNIGDWQPRTIGELLEKNYILTKSLTGCGFLEVWEWHYIEPLINPINFGKHIEFAKFSESVSYTRRVVEWGTSMVRAVYNPVINLFSRFEPLAIGFLDDRIRSSLLLAQGELAGQMAEVLTAKSGVKHQMTGIRNQGQIRGLNPGYAFGELEVVTGDPEKVLFSTKKIYFIQRAPVDMKPVAGIATVSEGNLVSHVQLLARNLGIPNAVISEQNLADLLPYSGKNVFYAVSPGGTVVLKLESNMSAKERALIEEQKRSDERIYVPATKINLKKTELLNLKNLRSSDSGSLCGPKAANLGQLKSLFPDKVVNGIVIPFGIFREHLDQSMPGSDTSYWSFLQNTFKEASILKSTGKSDEEIETWILKQFMELQEAIRTMPFLSGFREKLSEQFMQIFGKDMGEIPVFIRSDTNMEDLKDFTGAGLNLTVFNVREPEKIFKSIRDVWASPYSERSYLWRQKYLLNPENVFPSILIIPTVPVKKSGVLITTGITSTQAEDLTVAFNRGAGGAVEGQMAESYLLEKNGPDKLISPSRERAYTDLPEQGGTLKRFSNFNQRILSTENLKQIRLFSQEMQIKLRDRSGINSNGPYDVEFGFLDDKIWLFQVRPYVESKKARSSDYLQSINPEIKNQPNILLEEEY
jgi:hypothetical protein